MRPPRNPKLFLDAARDHERRRHGRLRTEELVCSLGIVTDMSASGMQIQRKGRPTVELGDCVNLTLTYGERRLNVNVRVTRLIRVGFRRYTYGLEFVSPTPEEQIQITAFARIAADQLTLGRPASA